jgi:hypothetical protein
MAKKISDLGQNVLPKDWHPQEYLTDDIIAMYKWYIAKGQIDKAITYIADYYPKKIAYLIYQERKAALELAAQRELTIAEMNAMGSRISLVTSATKDAITSGVRHFTTNVIAGYFFQMNDITDKTVQKSILNATLGQFESYVNGAMSQTPVNIMNSVRDMQKNWIIRNQQLNNLDNIDELLNVSETEFKAMLKKRYPEYFQDIEDGRILKSRLFGKNLDRINSYTLEEYTGFSVRATILNIDRNSAEISASSKGHSVVEYYLRDKRPIKTVEREVCQHILGIKIKGLSLLALTSEASDALGIKTLSNARELGAMYIHCRHSIRPVSQEFDDEIFKVVKMSETASEVVEV